MHNLLQSLSGQDLIIINSSIDEGIVKSNNLVNSCFSSFSYYNNIEDQIASIFKSIVLNHCFNNGNKRTAVAFLIIVSNRLKLKTVNDDKLFDITLNIANSKLTKVEEISKLIFEK